MKATTKQYEVQAEQFDSLDANDSINRIVAMCERQLGMQGGTLIYSITTIGSGEHGGKRQVELHADGLHMFVIEGMWLVADGKSFATMDDAKFQSRYDIVGG